MIQEYNITGMSCAACQASVQRAVSKVDGVLSCQVNLLTNSMKVEGDVDSKMVIEAVESAGYGASVKTGGILNNKTSVDSTSKKLKFRLISSIVILVVLMYFSMGVMMWNFPAPSPLKGHVFISTLEAVLSLAIMVINRKFFVSGVKAVLHGSPNMDTLVAMGSFVSYAWSFYLYVKILLAHFAGDMAQAHELSMNLYFESAAMIVTLITIGKLLESLAKGKTTSALKGLISLMPKDAIVLIDGKEKRMKVENVPIGATILIKPGDKIPFDSKVLLGVSSVNESSLTGEPLPKEKAAGDMVYSGTINQYGSLTCEVLKNAEESTLGQMIKMVSDAASSKAPIAKIADKVSAVFVPVVLGIGLFTTLVWLLIGAPLGTALSYGITVLVISCPCSLGLATPVAIMVGTGVGAKHGILFKNAESLEVAGKVNLVALDKTGTLTKGEPTVTDIKPIEDMEELKLAAYLLEQKSEHPIAKAVISYLSDYETNLELEEVEAIPGGGLRGKLGEDIYLAGNIRLLSQSISFQKSLQDELQMYQEMGKTPLLFAKNNVYLGLICISDPIKKDSKEAIDILRTSGIQVALLTGDSTGTAKYMASQAGITDIHAELLPKDKSQILKEYQKTHKVAMVGDGINDALALTEADLGIAIGAGNDIALDSADVVLMKSSLLDVSRAIHLSKKTIRNIYENLFWAFIYNMICIPIAAGAFTFLGVHLNPSFGALAMSLSSVCVVSNALRLNLVKMDRDLSYKTVLTVSGMMCHHCEAKVQKAILADQNVISAKANYKNKKVVVLSHEPLSLDGISHRLSDVEYILKKAKQKRRS